MMGLLRECGVFVGLDDRLAPANGLNRKGFFEIRDHNKFLAERFGPHLQRRFDMPSVDDVVARASASADAYFEMLERDFDGRPVIAIKAAQCLTASIFSTSPLADRTRVVMLSRNLDDQARSLAKIWSYGPDPQDQAFARRYLAYATDRAEEILGAAALPTLRVSFERLMHEADAVAEEVCSFVGLQSKSAASFIEPNLATCLRSEPT